MGVTGERSRDRQGEQGTLLTARAVKSDGVKMWRAGSLVHLKSAS